MFASFSGETPQIVAERYERYGDLKKDLAELVIASLVPIQSRYRELRSDEGALRALAARGAEKASDVAGPLYDRAAKAMGL